MLMKLTPLERFTDLGKLNFIEVRKYSFILKLWIGIKALSFKG